MHKQDDLEDKAGSRSWLVLPKEELRKVMEDGEHHWRGELGEDEVRACTCLNSAESWSAFQLERWYQMI